MANYTIQVENDEFKIEESETQQLNVVQVGKNTFHLLHNNKAYHAEVRSTGDADKELAISVNGNTYTVQIQDEYDALVKNMGFLYAASQKVKDISAPMPGLILNILVENGEEVLEGTPLMVLSAMKMENIILSPNEGVVKSIEVEKDASVDKGQLLIVME